jgi:hypothetical protein
MISCIQNSRGLLFQKKVSLREAFVFAEQRADEDCSAGLLGAETFCNPNDRGQTLRPNW